MAPSVRARAAPRLGVDELGVNEAARAEVHAVLLLALAPEGRADVADAHRLGDARAPALLEPRAERGLAAARLTCDEKAHDARAAQVEVPRRRPLDQIGGIRRRQRDRSGLEPLDREHQPLGVPGADRDVAEPDPLEGRERGPATNGPAP